MISHHALMYGEIGQIAAEAVVRWGSLWPGLDALDFRILLAPVELGPYNRHLGYTHTCRPAHAPRYILVNRKICRWEEDGTIGLARDHQFMIDILVHEMTHHRQRDIINRDGIGQTRGGHRDRGWYKAIQEAAPKYLGVEFPPERWPKQKPCGGRLTEVEACRWPHSFRPLIASKDARLSPVDDLERFRALDGTSGPSPLSERIAVG